jgi:hypothetical protein
MIHHPPADFSRGNPSLCGDLPAEVVRHWFPESSILSVEPVGGGLSGASVWRVCSASTILTERQPPEISAVRGPSTTLSKLCENWALKRWPEGSRTERISEIHAVLETARQNKCPAIPEALSVGIPPATWKSIDGAIWECSRWTEGQPPNLRESLELTVVQMARWVAQFAESVKCRGSKQGVPRTILDRQHRMAGIEKGLSRRLGLASTGVFDRYDDSQRRILTLGVQVLENAWPRIAPKITSELLGWAEVTHRLQYVVRDVHFGNTLFQDGKLTAFVDFDAVRMDTLAADLSRLVGSVLMELAGDVDQDAIWNHALAAYRSIRPLSPTEEALAKWLVDINPLINLANWIIWLAVEGRDFGDSQSMAFQRLEQWTAVVACQSGVTRKPFGC